MSNDGWPGQRRLWKGRASATLAAGMKYSFSSSALTLLLLYATLTSAAQTECFSCTSNPNWSYYLDRIEGLLPLNDSLLPPLANLSCIFGPIRIYADRTAVNCSGKCMKWTSTQILPDGGVEVSTLRGCFHRLVNLTLHPESTDDRCYQSPADYNHKVDIEYSSLCFCGGFVCNSCTATHCDRTLMIFINTRPVDEEALGPSNSRRKSSGAASTRKAQPATQFNTPKLSMLLCLLYGVASCACIVLYYPLSLTCLLLPSLLLVYLLFSLKRHSQFDVWTCTLMATLGLLIKGASLIVFLSLFQVSPLEEKRTASTRDRRGWIDSRSLFFLVVFIVEVVAVFVSVCLKWHLLAFRQTDDSLRPLRRQSKRLATNS